MVPLFQVHCAPLLRPQPPHWQFPPQVWCAQFALPSPHCCVAPGEQDPWPPHPPHPPQLQAPSQVRYWVPQRPQPCDWVSLGAHAPWPPQVLKAPHVQLAVQVRVWLPQLPHPCVSVALGVQTPSLPHVPHAPQAPQLHALLQVRVRVWVPQLPQLWLSVSLDPGVQPPPLGMEQVPPLQKLIPQALLYAEQSIAVPTQVPPLQTSLMVHALPSVQLELLLLCWQPLVVLQLSVVQTLVSSQLMELPGTHVPLLHKSLTVQAFPSLQLAVLLA